MLIEEIFSVASSGIATSIVDGSTEIISSSNTKLSGAFVIFGTIGIVFILSMGTAAVTVFASVVIYCVSIFSPFESRRTIMA